MSPSQGFSRRRFLEIAGVAGGVVALRQSLLSLRIAEAAPGKAPLLLSVYFEGGWDQLIALDPRDTTDPRFQRDSAYSAGGSGLHVAYEMLQNNDVRAVLQQTPSGVQKRGNLTFGPAVAPSLMDHFQDLAVVRGINMDTLTHEVGRRYFITGKMPRGLTASGSSAGTAVAAQAGQDAVIPNLAVGTEAYNEAFASFASPVRVNVAADMLNVLRPLGNELPPASQAAIEAYEAVTTTCEHDLYDSDGLVTALKASRKRARGFAAGNVATLFQFNPLQPAPEVKGLFSALKITTNADLTGPKGRAAIAAQALANGLSQAVSVVLAQGLDAHFDWTTNHPTLQRAAWDALGNLITYLKNTRYKNTNDSVWSHTTLVAFSEFSRTPLLNSRDGRDHHLASSCLVGGPGIRGNFVCGGTSDNRMSALATNFNTGQVDEQKGQAIRPADVHATLFKAMGLSWDHISNQTPQLLGALLK